MTEEDVYDRHTQKIRALELQMDEIKDELDKFHTEFNVHSH